jgi:hypothetical protein
MSNHLAVATVTAALRKLLADRVSLAVAGAQVTVKNPAAVTPVTDPNVNLFLYEVAPNPALRNHHVPTRRGDGSVAQRPLAALDLHYLISFYGDFDSLQPHRLLGAAVTALEEHPVLTADDIGDAIVAYPTYQLAGSDLADQVDRVRLSPLSLSLEDLTRLWGTFVQASYVTSVAWQASVVLLEAQVQRRTALPVKSSALYVRTFQAPVVDLVENAAGVTVPIEATSDVLLIGDGLRGEDTIVRIGAGAGEAGAPTAITPAEIRVDLDAVFGTALRAGVRAIQVIHRIAMGDPATPREVVTSNTAAFVLRPTVTSPGHSAGTVTLSIVPAVGEDQLTELLLTDTTTGAGYTFRGGAYTPGTPGTLAFDVAGLAAGTYLVRVRVDGAESVPTDSDDDGELDTPSVTL